VSRIGGRPGLEQIWRRIYDRAYKVEPDAAELPMDTSGWVNTYTGLPYTQEEMREWVDQTVGRILEHAPQRVLEIGCGTGLLGNRLIPEVEAYCGLDFSVGALQRFSRGIDPATNTLFSLLHASAKDLHRVPRWEFDCVVLNSVLQYFPDPRYVQEVLRQATTLLKPPGILFLGDIRHQQLLATHHAWCEWRSAPDEMTVQEIRAAVTRRQRADREWSCAPADLVGLLSAVGAQHTEVRLKDGTHPTEMNLFRYDAIGYFQPVQERVIPDARIEWTPGREREFDRYADRSIILSGVPHTRLLPAIEAEGTLRNAQEYMTIGELRRTGPAARRPDDALTVVRHAARSIGATTHTNWTRDPSGHTVDVAVVSAKDSGNTGPLLVHWPALRQSGVV
jgi:SAM-dependent methyltransferase